MKDRKTTIWGIVGAVGFIAFGLATAVGYDVDTERWQQIVQVAAMIVTAAGWARVAAVAKDAD